MRPSSWRRSCRSSASRRTSTSRRRRSCSGWPTASQGSGRSRSSPSPRSPSRRTRSRNRSHVGSWAVVGVVFAATTLAAHASMSVASGAASLSASARTHAGSITPCPGRGCPCAVGRAARRRDFGRATRDIWMSELFNRSVGQVVEVGTPMPYDLPHESASIRDGVLRDASGKPIVADYVLAPCDVEIAGQVVATDRHVDSRLYASRWGRPHFPAGARGRRELRSADWRPELARAHGKAIHGDRALDDGPAGHGSYGWCAARAGPAGLRGS